MASTGEDPWEALEAQLREQLAENEAKLVDVDHAQQHGRALTPVIETLRERLLDEFVLLDQERDDADELLAAALVDCAHSSFLATYRIFEAWLRSEGFMVTMHLELSPSQLDALADRDDL